MTENHPSSSSSTSRGTVLQRGKACIRCRRRKMKCDGARPVCSPCIGANRVDDCEYTDNQGMTRTQMLEENVARLEARIRELEGNTDSGLPLLLHDPYSTPAPPIASQAGRSDLPRQDQWWAHEELPGQISEALISVFLPHSRVLGFSIDPARFRYHTGLPNSHLERPHLALLNAVYLWAIRISNSMELRQHEDVFLQRAILALQDSSNSQHEYAGRRRVQAVQAEILLSQYFFCLGQNVEGRYHANAAVALALSCSLHKIIASVDAFRVGGGSHTSSFASSVNLAPPRDASERAERIRVFWAVFDLDSCWSTALEVPRSLSDDASRGTRIDTPWSEELGANNDGRTVQRFLSGHSVLQDDNSYLGFRSKASALYGRAASLAGQATPGLFIEEEVQRLARITAEFAGGLPPLDELNAVGDDIRLSIVVAHSLAHASMIHLHRALSQGAAERPSIAFLPHAEEILAILEIACNINSGNEETMQSNVLDPILAVCGSMAGHIFIEELNRSRRNSRTHEAQSQRRRLRISIDHLISALYKCSGFANAYPIFSQHASLIEEELPDDLLKD